MRCDHGNRGACRNHKDLNTSRGRSAGLLPANDCRYGGGYRVVEAGAKLVAIEVKLSATARPAMASLINMFQKNFGDKVLGGTIK